MKVCKECSNPVWSKGLCKYHHRAQFPEKYRIATKTSPKPKSFKKPIQSKRKTTGELALFKQLWQDRGNKCQITGKVLEFSVWNFLHVLSKAAYKSYRLNPDNILIVDPRIHHLYDNSSKEKLLQEFPEAVIIYEIKDRLRYDYYN